MVRLAKIEILAAGSGHARGKFGPDECAEQSEYAAENPDTENQKRRVDVERDDVGIDEDAGADDAAHDDHGGVERDLGGAVGWGVAKGARIYKARRGSTEARK